jgi:hypothetical protein
MPGIYRWRDETTIADLSFTWIEKLVLTSTQQNPLIAQRW